MIKNRDEVRRDVLDMCGWVQDSYQLPENFFLEQFHKLLNNLEEELMMAKTSDEYRKEHLLVWHKGIICLNNMYLRKKWNDLLLFLVILFALFSSFIDN